jgi:hypothetical protein
MLRTRACDRWSAPHTSSRIDNSPACCLLSLSLSHTVILQTLQWRMGGIASGWRSMGVIGSSVHTRCWQAFAATALLTVCSLLCLSSNLMLVSLFGPSLPLGCQQVWCTVGRRVLAACLQRAHYTRSAISSQACESRSRLWIRSSYMGKLVHCSSVISGKKLSSKHTWNSCINVTLSTVNTPKRPARLAPALDLDLRPGLCLMQPGLPMGLLHPCYSVELLLCLKYLRFVYHKGKACI